jgi:hypothetical protein
MLPILFIILIPIFMDMRFNLVILFFILLMSYIFLIMAIDVGMSYNQYYPSWVISMVFGFIIVNHTCNKLSEKGDEYLRTMKNIFIIIFSVIIISLIFYGETIDNRKSFIFGPNMLYRNIGFFSIIISGYFALHRRKSLSFIIFLITLIPVYLAGSRGGLFMIILLLISIFHALYRKLSLRKLLPIALSFSFILFYIINNNIGINRIFYYQDIDFNSYNYTDAYSRLRPYLFFIYDDNPTKLIGIKHFEFMEAMGIYPSFQYPHNLFLDLIIFYGYFGVIFSIVILVKIIIVIKHILTEYITPLKIFQYSILSIMVGTMLSGEMGDNGVIIGAIFGLGSNKKRKSYLPGFNS